MGRMNVLVVEDEVLIRLHLVDVLRTLECEVIGETAYGEEAVEIFTDRRPDLVLMDIRLKGTMNGIEAAKLIISIQQVPVVFISAYDLEESLTGENIPCFFYLTKPVDEYMLEPVLERVRDEHLHLPI